MENENWEQNNIIGLDGEEKSSIMTKLKGIKREELVEIFQTPFINWDYIT